MAIRIRRRRVRPKRKSPKRVYIRIRTPIEICMWYKNHKPGYRPEIPDYCRDILARLEKQSN